MMTVQLTFEIVFEKSFKFFLEKVLKSLVIPHKQIHGEKQRNKQWPQKKRLILLHPLLHAGCSSIKFKKKKAPLPGIEPRVTTPQGNL